MAGKGVENGLTVGCDERQVKAAERVDAVVGHPAADVCLSGRGGAQPM
jgi:hypothetical protein